jgi:hypothetical protein
MTRWSMLWAALLLPASLALADGDGPDRPLSAPEAAAFADLGRAIRAALPPAPANYALAFDDGSGKGGVRLPQALKAGQMARLRFAATYTLGQEAADAQLHNSFPDRAKGTPAQQARLAELDAKDQELTRRRDAARDRAEKDRIRAELKAVHDEQNRINDQVMADYQAWVASGGAMQAMQGAAQSAPPREFTVRVLVNQDVSVNGVAAPVKLAGAPLALEQSTGCEKYDDACLTVLLGRFDKDPEKRGSHWLYKLRPANLGVATQPRGIVLVVAGPKQHAQRVRDLAAQLDVAKLNALLP